MIDATTWVAAGDAARSFVAHPATAIRGRDQLVDAYALPLELPPET